ncbi:MAG: FAD-dependent monooxygenase [Oxalobacteraceae bacterium]
MSTDCDICVIGGGAVGKAGALALAREGYRVALLSPEGEGMAFAGATDAPWDLRVYALNHVAHRLLSSLKVWDAMDASRIAPVDAMAVQGDDATRGHLEFNAYGARVGALAWIVEDSNLNQALDNALRFVNGVTQLRGRAVALSRTNQHAEVTLDNGSKVRASLVLGADGANSWVRAQVDIGMDYRSYHQRAVVANFSCTRPHHDVASQWFLGSEGIVALLPLPGHRVSLVWSAPDPLADQLLAEPAERIGERLAALTGQTLGDFTLLPPATPRAFPLRLIRAHSLIAHRVALLGDAAHVVHPLAGQGMNLGFADIDALLAALRAQGRDADCGDDRLLARYARLRKEDVLLMQLTTDVLQRLFASELLPVKMLRNAGMGLLNKLPFIKQRLVSQALGRSHHSSANERT